MKHIRVTEDVAGILCRSKIEGNKLTLPEQLARPDYVKVMKVIDAAGGKWNKKEGCHIFPDDPTETFSTALGSKQIADNSERAVRSAKQAFYTPPVVADKLIELAVIAMHHDILEPSAGMGGIALRLFPDGGGTRPVNRNGRILLIENDPMACEFLRKEFNPDMIVEVDFMKVGLPIRLFDRVLMNPPFTKGQDVDHVTHAFKFLKKDGWLLAIISRSFEHHTGKKYVAFRDLLAKHGSVLERLTNGEFKDSGTSVDTVIVRLIK